MVAKPREMWGVRPSCFIYSSVWPCGRGRAGSRRRKQTVRRCPLQSSENHFTEGETEVEWWAKGAPLTSGSSIGTFFSPLSHLTTTSFLFNPLPQSFTSQGVVLTGESHWEGNAGDHMQGLSPATQVLHQWVHLQCLMSWGPSHHTAKAGLKLLLHLSSKCWSYRFTDLSVPVQKM